MIALLVGAGKKLLHTHFSIKACWFHNTRFLYPLPDNSESRIIQHLKRVVPRPEVLLFTRKKIIIKGTGRSQRHVQIGHLECLHINYCGTSWPDVSYSINFFTYKDSQKAEKRTLMTLNQQTKEITKFNTPVTTCSAQI